jgi:hypothetical protein
MKKMPIGAVGILFLFSMNLAFALEDDDGVVIDIPHYNSADESSSSDDNVLTEQSGQQEPEVGLGLSSNHKSDNEFGEFIRAEQKNESSANLMPRSIDNEFDNAQNKGILSRLLEFCCFCSCLSRKK